MVDKKIISITGTPGTGKTMVAMLLAKKLNGNHIEISKLIRNKEIPYALDKKRNTKIIDVKKMRTAVRKKILRNRINIIDGHLSHFIKSDFVVLLRTDPVVLKKRLKSRKWKYAKIKENVQAEEGKEFFISLDMPKNTTQYNTFIAHVDIRNLQDKEKTADILFNIGNQKQSKVVSFTPGQQKRISFNITADYLGEQEVSIHARSDSLSTYTTSILVYREGPEPQPRNIFDDLNDVLADFFTWLHGLF